MAGDARENFTAAMEDIYSREPERYQAIRWKVERQTRNNDHPIPPMLLPNHPGISAKNAQELATRFVHEMETIKEGGYAQAWDQLSQAYPDRPNNPTINESYFLNAKNAVDKLCLKLSDGGHHPVCDGAHEAVEHYFHGLPASANPKALNIGF